MNQLQPLPAADTPGTIAVSNNELAPVNDKAFAEFRRTEGWQVIAMAPVRHENIAQWYANWINERINLGMAKVTIRKMRECWTLWHTFWIGRDTEQCSVESYQRWCAWVRTERSPVVANDATVTMRIFWKWVVESGRCLPQQNITRLGPLYPRSRPKYRKPALYSDYLDLLERARNYHTFPMYYILVVTYETGLRVGGCCMLRWDEVDLEQRVIRIVDQKSIKRNHASVIPYDAGSNLDQLLDARLKLVAKGERYVHPFWAETYKNDPARVHQICCKWLRKTQQSPFTIHSFRRSMATNLVNSGAPLCQVAAVTGHADMAALKSYVGVDIEKLREAMRAARLYAMQNRPIISI